MSEHLKNFDLKIIRKAAVLERLCISHSSLYRSINEGLLPPPINLGARSVGWLEHEIYTVMYAMVKEYSKEDIQAIVKQLVKDREDIEMLSGASQGSLNKSEREVK
ncbi:helix-turn-helix transcriptional regulator [Catenovulum agarivorans]|uniref:helix-turn-helix transcriptional regulator n=1 Tax=Catenovulum agarivorans TaxID=1172192 RepID=UPI000382A8C7|nr:AlpA family phage regulatory protein [Catenovulum agarivorans]